MLTRALKTSAPTLLLFAIFAQWAHAHPEGITLSSLRVARDGVRIETVLPDGFIDAYAWLARLGSGVFLVVQMVILLDFGECLSFKIYPYGQSD